VTEQHLPEGAEPGMDAEELELLELEAEARRLEARAAARRRLGRRRALLWQAPVLALAAIALLVWGRTTSGPDTASAAPPETAAQAAAYAHKAEISLSSVHIDPPAKPGDPVYVYLTVRNIGGVADKLVNATTPWAGSVDLVGPGGKGGVPWIVVPAHGSVTLRADGDALALRSLKREPKRGDTVQIGISFALSGTVQCFAYVGPVGAMTPQDVMEAMKYMDRIPPTSVMP